MHVHPSVSITHKVSNRHHRLHHKQTAVTSCSHSPLTWSALESACRFEVSRAHNNMNQQYFAIFYIGESPGSGALHLRNQGGARRSAGVMPWYQGFPLHKNHTVGIPASMVGIRFSVMPAMHFKHLNAHRPGFYDCEKYFTNGQNSMHTLTFRYSDVFSLG